jgi:hypothetical protein
MIVMASNGQRLGQIPQHVLSLASAESRRSFERTYAEPGRELAIKLRMKFQTDSSEMKAIHRKGQRDHNGVRKHTLSVGLTSVKV